MSLNMKIVVNHTQITENLLKACGINVMIYAQDSYSGTMVCCEDKTDFYKMDNDEEYANQRIVETTTNF